MGSVVKEAQNLLIASGAPLVADGMWGRRTQAAYDAVSTDLKQQISFLFTRQGKVAPWDQRWISVAEANALVARAAEEAGMSAHIQELQQFLRYEAPRDKSGAYYNVNAVNGSSRGLMQMQKAAWNDARARHPSLAGYEKVFDPYQNILAGVVYARINSVGIARRGFAVTGKNLYLAHNQGMGFFDGKRTAIGNQSKVVQDLIAKGPDR